MQAKLIAPSRGVRHELHALLHGHRLMMGPGLLIDVKTGDVRPRLIAWPLLPGRPCTDVTGRA